MFPSYCVQVETGHHIVFRDKKRTFHLRNPKGQTVRKVRLDGCVITQAPGQRACDYGAWVDSKNLAYLIELKGKNIRHAVCQLEASIDYICTHHPNEIKGRNIQAVVVSSKNKVPKLTQSPEYIRLKRKTSSVYIKNDYFEMSL